MSKQFSATTCRKRMGMSQGAFGLMLKLGSNRKSAERAVQRWEKHERDGSDHGPSTQAVMLMMVMEKLWRMFHGPRSNKKNIGKLLPEELRERKP